MKNLTSKNRSRTELPEFGSHENLTHSITGTDVTFEVDNVERKKLAPAVGHVHVYLLHPPT